MSLSLARALALTCIAQFASAARAQDDAGIPAEVPGMTASDTCGAARFVVLDAAPDLDPELVREVATDLGTELSRRGLSLCPAGSTEREPAAVIHLKVTGDVAGLELDDRTTQKRVFRDLRLGQTASSARALAIAIAIDELLRASWAELTMREATPTNAPQLAPPPPKVVAAPAPAPEEPREAREPPHRVPSTLRLGGLFGYMHGAEQFDAFAVSAEADLQYGALWLATTLGAIATLPAEHALGEVSARGLTSSLTVGGCLGLGLRTRLCAGPRTGIDWLKFDSSATRGAEAHAGSGYLWRLEGVGALSVRASERLALSLVLGAGGPLHALRARAGREVLVGASGLLLSAQVGVGVEL